MTEYLAKSVESTLARAYGTGSTVETGRNTLGHQCISSSEQASCNAKKTGLLTYGELLPDGVCKLFDAEHLDVGAATTLLDLGMGTGKVLMQAFLAASNDTPNLSTMIGVELAESRYGFAAAAAHCLVEQNPSLYQITKSTPGKCVQVSDSQGRTLEFRCGDLFEAVSDEELDSAEAIVLETCFPAAAFAPLADLLLKRATRPRCKVVLYHDLKHLWAALPFGLPESPGDSADSKKMSSNDSKDIPIVCAESGHPYSGLPASNGHRSGAASGTDNQSRNLEERVSSIAAARSSVPPCPFHQLPVNVDPAIDRFATSWAPELGFHFFLYVREDTIPPSLTHFPHALVADLLCRESRRAAPIEALSPSGVRGSKNENQESHNDEEEDKELPLELAARLAAELATMENQQPMLDENASGAVAEPSLFVPGRRVEVLNVCVPTDLLCLGDNHNGEKEEEAGGEWNAGWVLSPCKDSKRPFCYRVVLDDGEVEECVEAACMWVLRA